MTSTKRDDPYVDWLNANLHLLSQHPERGSRYERDLKLAFNSGSRSRSLLVCALRQVITTEELALRSGCGYNANNHHEACMALGETPKTREELLA